MFRATKIITQDWCFPWLLLELRWKKACKNQQNHSWRKHGESSSSMCSVSSSMYAKWSYGATETKTKRRFCQRYNWLEKQRYIIIYTNILQNLMKAVLNVSHIELFKFKKIDLCLYRCFRSLKTLRGFLKKRMFPFKKLWGSNLQKLISQVLLLFDPYYWR